VITPTPGTAMVMKSRSPMITWSGWDWAMM